MYPQVAWRLPGQWDTEKSLKGAETLEDPPVSWSDINVTTRTNVCPLPCAPTEHLWGSRLLSPSNSQAFPELPAGAPGQWRKKTHPCSTVLKNTCHHRQDGLNVPSAPTDTVSGAKQGAWVNLEAEREIDFQIISQSIVVKEEKRPKQS